MKLFGQVSFSKTTAVLCYFKWLLAYLYLLIQWSTSESWNICTCSHYLLIFLGSQVFTHVSRLLDQQFKWTSAPKIHICQKQFRNYMFQWQSFLIAEILDILRSWRIHHLQTWKNITARLHVHVLNILICWKWFFQVSIETLLPGVTDASKFIFSFVYLYMRYTYDSEKLPPLLLFFSTFTVVQKKTVVQMKNSPTQSTIINQMKTGWQIHIS